MVDDPVRRYLPTRGSPSSYLSSFIRRGELLNNPSHKQIPQPSVIQLSSLKSGKSRS